jgi:predicted RNase H-like HicB family nuclease
LNYKEDLDKMRKYIIMIEKTLDGYNASVPILPGCVAMADTKKEVEKLIYETILFHIEGLEKEGLSIPEENDVEVETMVFA